MTGTRKTHSDRLRAALRPFAKKVRVNRTGVFSFSLQNGATVPVRGRLSGDWARMETGRLGKSNGACEPSPIKATIQQALEWNAQLPGPARFALSDARDRLSLISDLPFEEESLNEAAIQSALRALQTGLALWSGKEIDQAPVLQPEEAAYAPALETLKQKADETPWEYKARAGELAFDLHVPHAFCQALVRPLTEDRVLISSEVHQYEAASDLSKQAKAALLLVVTARVRMAGASVGIDDGVSVYTLRDVLPASMPPALLAHVLGAHAVAARQCVEPLRALDDEILARAYLEAALPGKSQ